MSDNIKHTDEKDVFSTLIKEKLENHQLPVDESIWNAIEQKMTPRRRIITPVWYWISGAAVAVVALLLIINPFYETKQIPALTGVQQTEMLKPDSSPQLQYDRQIQAAEKVEDVFTALTGSNKNTENTGNNLSDQTASTSEKQLLITENRNKLYTTAPGETRITETQTAEVQKPEEKVMNDAVNAVVDSVRQKKTTTGTPVTSLPDLNDYPEVPPAKHQPLKKRPLLIAAAVGTGGSLSSISQFDGGVKFYDSSPSLVKREIASNYTTVLDANDYTEAKHDPPVSAGIMLVKPLNRTLSLESGLIYTYLRSEYYRPGLTDYRGVLQLHYLGVPLNMRALLIDFPKWNLYVSAGGMVEKGLRSIYMQEIEDQQATANTNVKSGIDGLQWSLNGALGAEYKLRKGLSLYAEPELTYYLRNNQPRSARTEQPLTIGLNGGLRIEL